jgi:hypothetical protein
LFQKNCSLACRKRVVGSDLSSERTKIWVKPKGGSRHEIHPDDEHDASGPRGSGVASARSSGAYRIYDAAEQGPRESGELVSAEGLSSPDQAKLVRAGKDGVPITDGVFPESKEFLAGYWIVDVDSPDRAYAIAARASAAPGPGGAPLNMPIEVRPVMSAPPPEILQMDRR